MFNKTFFHFFFGFVVIIGVAFGVMVTASYISAPDRNLDSVAHPR